MKASGSRSATKWISSLSGAAKRIRATVSDHSSVAFVASRRADGPVATIAIERMEFIAPIHLRDLISVYAQVEHVGRTSMKVRIEVIAQRDRGATEVKVTEGLFTFVALDENHRPRPVEPDNA